MFPKYPQRKDKNAKESNKRALPKPDKPKEKEIPASTVPEYEIADIDTFDTTGTNGFIIRRTDDEINQLIEKNGSGVKIGIGKRGRPTLQEQQKITEECGKYHKIGLGATVVAEITGLNIDTVRDYFREQRDLAKLSLAENWVDEQKGQKAEMMNLLERNILKLAFSLNNVETAIKSFNKDEDIRRKKVEDANDQIMLWNQEHTDQPSKQLETRQPQTPFALIKYQQALIKDMSGLQTYRANLAMQPTAGESLENYFKDIDTRRDAMQKKLEEEGKL